MKKIAKRVSEIQVRLRELHATLEKEQRALNDEEKKEVAALEREQDLLILQARSLQIPLDEKKPLTAVDYFRAMVDSGRGSIEMRVRSEGGEPTAPSTSDEITTMLTTDIEGKALMPYTSGDIIKPLSQALIYDKIGIKMPTGCRGTYEWPVVEAIKATIAGEAVKVGAQKIDLSKVAVVTQRIAVVCEASRESLFQTDGKLERIIRELMPAAIADTLNQIITSRTKVTANCAISGPLVGLTAKQTDFTYKGFNLAKAALLAEGVRSDRMCWIMTESTKAELEATPKDTGSGIMTIEDDKLCGLPVFTSEHIGEGYVGLGDFTYQVLNQFGDFYLVVDPYTGADANTVRFALNSNFGTARLRQEAFALLQKKTAS